MCTHYGVRVRDRYDASPDPELDMRWAASSSSLLRRCDSACSCRTHPRCASSMIAVAPSLNVGSIRLSCEVFSQTAWLEPLAGSRVDVLGLSAIKIAPAAQLCISTLLASVSVDFTWKPVHITSKSYDCSIP